MSGTCRGCGAQLPPQSWTGRRREWCSDRCRRDTLYGGACIECGAPTSGCNGRGPNAPERCSECSLARGRAIANANRSEAAAPRRERVAELYNAGVSFKEMAAEFGVSVGSISGQINKMREAGWDLPRRYPLERAQAISAGKRAAQRERAAS